MNENLPKDAGWRDISSAPDDGRRIWVFGGRYKEVAIIDADGDWWRTCQLPGVTPTHWQPLIKPSPPEGTPA